MKGKEFIFQNMCCRLGSWELKDLC